MARLSLSTTLIAVSFATLVLLCLSSTRVCNATITNHNDYKDPEQRPFVDKLIDGLGTFVNLQRRHGIHNSGREHAMSRAVEEVSKLMAILGSVNESEVLGVMEVKEAATEWVAELQRSRDTRYMLHTIGSTANQLEDDLRTQSDPDNIKQYPNKYKCSWINLRVLDDCHNSTTLSQDQVEVKQYLFNNTLCSCSEDDILLTETNRAKYSLCVHPESGCTVM